MHKKTTSKHSAFLKTGRTHPVLTHWVGEDQHVATGVSTDPASRRPIKPGPQRGGQARED